MIEREVTSSVSGILRDSSHLRQARSRCLRCCPRVAVTTLGLPPHRARGGHAHLGQMQRFGPSSRLVTIGRVKALMVFKTVRNLPSADAPTWTFSVFTVCVAQDHPAHIP
jgi:hypothetical protein